MNVVNLNRNGAEMQSAWKAVLDDADDTDWALFGYEANTSAQGSYVLNLVEKGDGGVDELVQELNANKIMYAFIRVEDPKTSLPKYVMLNWQGESAPGTKKGICSTHLKDISAYFR